MGWLGWAIGPVVGLFVLDRLALWAEARGWIYWRRRSPRTSSGSGAVLGVLMEAFHPGHRIVVEERRFRELRVDELGSPADRVPGREPPDRGAPRRD